MIERKQNLKRRLQKQNNLHNNTENKKFEVNA